MDLNAIDVLDPELYRGDPHPALAWLRAHDPVRWDSRHRLWLVTRWADVVHVLKHPALYCSGEGIRPNSDVKVGLITEDEPRHGALRRLVNRGFTPRVVDRLEPRVREIATHCIDRFAAAGACDLVPALAVEVPLMVIAELLGVPTADRRRFWEWSDAIVAQDGCPEGSEGRRQGERATAELGAYLGGIVEERRRRPREDLVSVLAQAAEDPGSRDVLSREELLGFLLLLLVAGNETTRNAISGGIATLSQAPAARDELRARRGLLPSAVEEIVRWVSPVISFRRTATRDSELGGRSVRAGDQVVIFFLSANRDADVFAEPDVLRLNRTPNDHLGFGFGIHYCLGASLARLEIRVVLEELLRRLPDIRLAPGAAPVYAPSAAVRGITSLPVVFTPQ